MSDALAEPSHLQIILHNDNETPLQFVVELLHSVFNKQFIDAVRLTEAVDKDGQASCGSYPREVAADLLEAARQRVRVAGHPLRITSAAVTSDAEIFDGRCKLCGGLDCENVLSFRSTATPFAMTACSKSRGACPTWSARSRSIMPTKRWPGISPVFRGISWSLPRGNSPAICAPTFRLRSTGCSRRRRCGFLASTTSTAMRP